MYLHISCNVVISAIIERICSLTFALVALLYDSESARRYFTSSSLKAASLRISKASHRSLESEKYVVRQFSRSKLMLNCFQFSVRKYKVKGLFFLALRVMDNLFLCQGQNKCFKNSLNRPIWRPSGTPLKPSFLYLSKKREFKPKNMNSVFRTPF